MMNRTGVPLIPKATGIAIKSKEVRPSCCTIRTYNLIAKQHHHYLGTTERVKVMSAIINRISPDQREDFDSLLRLAKHDQLALVSSALDGKPVTVLSTVVEEENGDFTIYPLAVMVDEDIMSRLTNPASDIDSLTE